MSAIPASIVVIMAANDYYSYITEPLVYIFATLGVINIYLILIRFDDVPAKNGSKSKSLSKSRQQPVKSSTVSKSESADADV